ncbi:MAG: RIP metalloprotease RseP [Rikenellaceae bacterium]
MEILIKAAQLILCLSLLVILHEFGHFFFAKLFKCRVEKFYLFFNPKFSLFKKQIGETEYGIGWIPFGGYVKISGMIDESMDKDQMKQEPQPWEFRSKPAWQRLLIMIGGVLMNIITALAIYIGMSYSYGKTYIKNEDAKFGYQYSELAKEMGFKNGDKIININGKVYEDMSEIPMAFVLEDVTYATVERDGKTKELSIDFEYKSTLLNSTESFVSPRIYTKMDSVVVDMPAYKAGLQNKDSIISVNSQPVLFADQITEFITCCPDGFEIEFVRDSLGTKLIKTAVIVPEDGKIGVLYGGFDTKYYPITVKEYTFLEAVPQGAKLAVSAIEDYFKQLKIIFNPETEAYKQVGSVFSMGNFFPATWDWARFWSITAIFSIMLAVLNIMPIPALDGGHVLFLLYEIITRRKPSDKFMEIMQTIGMILLIGIMVLALGNDLFRMFK